MKKIIYNQSLFNSFIEKLKTYIIKEPITIEIEKLYKNRSNKQLRTFWLLVRILKTHMNECGNNFTDEDVATYFKLKAGHYIEKDNLKLPKSIDSKSGTTKTEMNKIINCMLEMGIDNNWEDVYIESEELNTLLNEYED